MDACAVLADTDDVGGPEEKIDRLGVLNNEGWFIEGVGDVMLVGLETCVGEVRSCSGEELGVYLGGGRGEKMVPAAVPCEGVFLAYVDAGKVQVGS